MRLEFRMNNNKEGRKEKTLVQIDRKEIERPSSADTIKHYTMQGTRRYNKRERRRIQSFYAKAQKMRSELKRGS